MKLIKCVSIGFVVFLMGLMYLHLDCSAQSILGRSARSGENIFTPQSPHVPRYPYVIARAADRQVIQNTPIEQRPNRPLHFYGNMVRRSNYSQSPFLPMSRF